MGRSSASERLSVSLKLHPKLGSLRGSLTLIETLRRSHPNVRRVGQNWRDGRDSNPRKLLRQRSAVAAMLPPRKLFHDFPGDIGKEPIPLSKPRFQLSRSRRNWLRGSELNRLISGLWARRAAVAPSSLQTKSIITCCTLSFNFYDLYKIVQTTS